MASIEKKGPDKWLLIVSDGFNNTGKRIKHTKIFNGTEKQAKKAAVLFENEVKLGKYASQGRVTLSQFVQIWERDHGRNLAPKTLKSYKYMLDNRILPNMGNIRVDKIRPHHIRQLMSTLASLQDKKDGQKNLSNDNLNHHFRCISAVLGKAVEWEYIANNPCAKIKPPSSDFKQIECYDEKQAQDMLNALGSEPLKHQVLINLAIATGARRGELVALEWKHIDFKNNTISIEQATQYVSEIGVITKLPKQNSIGTIAMPENAMDLLYTYRQEWISCREEAGNLWQDTDRLFVNLYNGKPLSPDWPTKWFRRFLQRHKLPLVRFHSLRHLSATLLIKSGVPLPNVSKRLRHAEQATTAKIYAHALKSVDRIAADKIGDFLNAPPNKEQT